jgi:hypothetical protein
MYVAVRRYEGVSDPQKVARLVEEGFIPIISEMPGFVAYYFVDARAAVAPIVANAAVEPIVASRAVEVGVAKATIDPDGVAVVAGAADESIVAIIANDVVVAVAAVDVIVAVVPDYRVGAPERVYPVNPRRTGDGVSCGVVGAVAETPRRTSHRLRPRRRPPQPAPPAPPKTVSSVSPALLLPLRAAPHSGQLGVPKVPSGGRAHPPNE